jgi:hypothetical protein
MNRICPRQLDGQYRNGARRGSAPVEFVMAMPVLLLMFVLIMSVGVFFLGQLKATITARSDAFQQRTSQKSQRPLAYNQQTSKSDIFSKSATENPIYPSPKISFGAVTSKHAILGGAWDHRELLKGNGPHWDDMGKASIGGATNQISSLIDQFSNGFDPSMIPGIGQLSDVFSSLLGESDSANSQFEQMQQEQQEQNKKNIEKLKQKIEELKAERAKLQGELDNMLYPQRKELTDRMAARQKDIDKETDADKKKALQKLQDQDKETLKQVNQQIKTKEDRIKAINKEIDANQGIIDRLQTL